MYSVRIEQTQAYKNRIVYAPLTDSFKESDKLSLFYAREFPYPYGWLIESGTPPENHLDVILMSDGDYKLGDTIKVKIIGVFKRSDDDHKLVAVPAGHDIDDLSQLSESALNHLNRLYVKLQDGEGWFGIEEANQVIEDYFTQEGNLIIREAAPYDMEKIKTVVKAAFYSEGKDPHFNEWTFAEKVTKDPGYVKPLCLVAVTKGKILGYALFSKANTGSCEGLALGPIAVAPDYQKSGIGKRLIETGLRRAHDLGYPWVAVLGGDYYLKFGFKPAQPYGMQLADNHPENPYLKVKFLSESMPLNGNIVYCDAFYNENGELL